MQIEISQKCHANLRTTSVQNRSLDCLQMVRAHHSGYRSAPAFPACPRPTRGFGPKRLPRRRRRVGPVGQLPVFGKISSKCCSFSAVSAPIFVSKYAFCSIFQNLPDYQAENFEIWQNFANFATFAKFCWIFTKIADFSNRFFAKILRLQRCKRMQIL